MLVNLIYFIFDVMKKEAQKNPPIQSGDKCNGVEKPTGPGDWICDNGKWVNIEVPQPDAK